MSGRLPDRRAGPYLFRGLLRLPSEGWGELALIDAGLGPSAPEDLVMAAATRKAQHAVSYADAFAVAAAQAYGAPFSPKTRNLRS